jgi:hypothetical protein
MGIGYPSYVGSINRRIMVQTSIKARFYLKKKKKKPKEGGALVAHIYNPSYSGSGDLEDRGSKPAQSNSF